MNMNRDIKMQIDKNMISIITVAYNAKDEIEKTIKSVLEQSYNNIEYIIIDGGSTDGTLEIIKKYEEKIDYWISEPDKGIYDAMNKGIRHAHGLWMNFLNAGDTYANNDVLVKMFSNNNDNTTLVYGDIFAIKENGEPLYVKAIELKDKNSIKKGMKVCHQAIFYHKKIMEDYDSNLKLKSEWKHLIHMTQKKNFKAKKFDFPVVNYSIGGLGAQLLKLNHKEYRKVFLEEYGKKEYYKYIPFFLYMTSRRVLKRLLKK